MFKSKRSSNKNRRKNKIFGVIFTSLVLGILLFSSPARAFTINLNVDKTSIFKGESVVFTASVNIDSNEHLPIDEFVLILDGPEIVTCRFMPDGAIISGCKGIGTGDIKIITSTSNYGYGYGYGNYEGYGYNFDHSYGYKHGLIVYQITVHTNNYATGQYKSKFKIVLGDTRDEFAEDGQAFTINPSSKDYSKLSVRASSSDTQVCLNGWKCTQWSGCNEGYQTRDCSKMVSNCYLGKKPEEKRNCIIELNSSSSLKSNPILPGNSISGNADEIKERKISESGINPETFSKITGAIIGSSKGVSPVIALIVLNLIIIAIITITIFFKTK